MNNQNIIASTTDQINMPNGTVTTSFSFYLFLLLSFILIGRPQDVFEFLQPARPALILTILNILIIFIQYKNLAALIPSQSIGRKYIYFYGMMILGIPFAYYRRGAFEFVFFQYIINILYFSLFLIHVHSYERLRSVVFTIVCSLLFYGIMTLSHGSYQENRLSFGSTYDPNDLAYMFVSLLPFTVFYISDSKNLITKLFAALTMIISSMLILFSGSRGGLIGFAIMLLLFLFSKLSPIRRSIKLALIIMILVFAVTNKDILFTGRYTTLMEVDQDYNVTDEYGRINLWKKAGEFIVKRPLTGVGALCFPNAIGFERRSRLGQERWQAVHNSYLQIASELGLIAFTIFILMIKESLRVLQKVRRSESKMINMTGIQNLAGIVQIGFICHLFVALFLTQGYSIIFTLFFAFATAFNKLLNQV